MNKSEPIAVVAAAIWDGVDSLLIGKRAEKDTFPGVWEFVGGKREDGESLVEALHREVKEELGIEIEVLKELGHHDFMGVTHQLRLYVYFTRWTQGVAQAFDHDEIEWVKTFELHERNWSDPDRPFLNSVAKLIKEY